MPFPADVEALDPAIPITGLVETTRSWSSGGELFEALASVDEPERNWSARDLERRANRVLAQRLLPGILTWPLAADEWWDALPAESQRPRETTLIPNSGTSWRETARLGWPPTAFHGRTRKRIADTLLVSTLKWTIESLQPVVADSDLVLPELLKPAATQLEAAFGLLEFELIDGAHGVTPSFADLMAVSSEGFPWNVLSPVTAELLEVQSDGILDLVDTLIVPDDELHGRLFHLGVLGELLVSLRAVGAEVVPLRPISASASPGPAYRVQGPDGTQWELWFEAAGIWRNRKVKSPYGHLSSAVPGAGNALGADILLALGDDRAALIECKYSAHPARVARNGFHQAAAYALEAAELFESVVSVVVGPSGIVIEPSFVTTSTAELGICQPEDMNALLAAIDFG